ncbi:SOS response-associated peptidase [Chelativorans sp. ZYF759]|uniref:SOS response-associated peptidase n=1 Tax=Chelativorans sp. ZYF759 TaxID=2692213 RepID=UPI00145E9CFF|nr:SOS response-associated peptidase [Chelativorans sp. ZYF759]NMG39090.1 SOS response-associated peptidase [Chelativorans sp. ZYF759]
MCGRFVLTSSPQMVEALFGIDHLEPPPPPRYNIAPTQPILIVTPGPTAAPGSNAPPRRAMLVRWGFLPGWVKDPKDFPLLINARSETAASKNSFRAAMRHRRVLIPASGFFEWRRSEGRKSQAYFIRPRDGGIVAFGGLLETYADAGGSEIDTAAILTTAANRAIAHIHDRMPVIIQPDDFSRWLDCISNEPADVADLMRPAPDDLMEAIPISDKVNKVANAGPDILEPVAAAQEPSSEERREDGRGEQLPLF